MKNVQVIVTELVIPTGGRRPEGGLPSGGSRFCNAGFLCTCLVTRGCVYTAATVMSPVSSFRPLFLFCNGKKTSTFRVHSFQGLRQTSTAQSLRRHGRPRSTSGRANCQSRQTGTVPCPAQKSTNPRTRTITLPPLPPTASSGCIFGSSAFCRS